MKSSIAQRIKQARCAKNLDQATLAAKIDIATRTLQRWEKGEQVPDSNYLMRIVKVTGVSAHWLLTGEGEMLPKESTSFPLLDTNRYNLVSLPILSSVPAGALTQIFHPDSSERTITVDNVHDSKAFALEVKGDSMAPRIENGDIIIVSPNQDVRSGDICVVRVNEEDTVKKVKFEGDFIHLIPLNPAYEPMVVRKRDVVLLWRVVKVVKSL